MKPRAAFLCFLLFMVTSRVPVTNGHEVAVSKNGPSPFNKLSVGLTAHETADIIQTGGAVSDLPLIEVPARPPSNDILAIFLTGDGGWAELDQGVSAKLAEHGISVMGWSTLKYFWTPRSPDLAAGDLERVLRHYMKLWEKEKCVLIGYSLGADVLPFMASCREGIISMTIIQQLPMRLYRVLEAGNNVLPSL